MIIKVAGYIPWRERLTLDECEAMSDDEGWDDFLEMAEDGAGSATSVRRIPTPIGNFSRHNDTARKNASVANWDSEFGNAQAHAREVMAKLGNG